MFKKVGLCRLSLRDAANKPRKIDLGILRLIPIILTRPAPWNLVRLLTPCFNSMEMPPFTIPIFRTFLLGIILGT